MDDMANVILLLGLITITAVSGFCPKGCQCDDIGLTVECSNTSLDVLPIALNMDIKHIKMSHNKIKIVDASFQFYEHLVSIDLSHNIITDVEDKSFAAQNNLQKLSLGGNRISSLSSEVGNIGSWELLLARSFYFYGHRIMFCPAAAS